MTNRGVTTRALTREEFERRINARISNEAWAIVEHVYMWHPSIPNVGGKDVIAQLYKIGGMAVIEDMDGTATARECMYDSITGSISEVGGYIERLDERIAELNSEKSALMRKREELQEEFRNMGF